MSTWIKLDKHQGAGSIGYSIPGKSDKLEFHEDDVISCKLQYGNIKKLPITFNYVQVVVTENGIPFHTNLKSPYVIDKVNSKNNYIILGDVEVNIDEVQRLSDENQKTQI